MIAGDWFVEKDLRQKSLFEHAITGPDKELYEVRDFLIFYLFKVYLFLVNKLNFQIIFNLKYDLFYSQAALLFLNP